MALPTDDMEWVHLLARMHDTDLPQLQRLNEYYEGCQPLTYMQDEIQRLVGDRIKKVVINWPQLVVDTIEERLDVTGFRMPGAENADKELWRVWQANNLDEETPLGRVDALTMKRSYMTVGTNEEDPATPLVTVESPLEMFAYIDVRTRRPIAALRRTVDQGDLARMPERAATLLLPNRTIWYDWADGWREIGRDEHNLGRLPVVPLVNRARTADRYGRSELAPILPLADAANKIATDMMVAAEFHAIPLRAIFGVGPDAFVDQAGNPLTAMQVLMGKLLAIPTEGDAKVEPFEFASSSLTNFHETIKTLAALTASLSGIDASQFGVHTDSPASAEAIVAKDARIVKKCERKHVAFEGTYEETHRLVRRFQSGDWDPALLQLETIWRDPATPTQAQTSDAAVKKHAQGLISRRQALEDCGYTSVQIDRNEREIAEESQNDPVGRMTKALAAQGA